MQLSKQQFNKLSKADKAMLSRSPLKKAPMKKKNPHKKSTGNGLKSSGLLPGQATGVASAYSKGVKTNRPRIEYSISGRECRIVHKEFVANVTGSVLFATPIQLALNPGLVSSFPWLSNIANNFELYRVNGMKICYLTRTGTNVPGSVLMYPDYDAADVAPVSEQIASNYSEIVEDAPWKDNCCILRPQGMHALGPKKFVRSQAVPATDIKTYDVGSFFLSTVDGTAVSWGKVWIEYDISFYEPQLNPLGVTLASSSIQSVSGTNAVPFLPANVVLAGPLISGIVGQIISFQNLIVGAEYFLSYSATTSASSGIQSVPIGLTLKNTFDAGASIANYTYTATAIVGSITLSAGVATNPLFVICQIPLGTL